MKVLLLLPLLIIYGCGEKIKTFSYGSTSAAGLVAQKGEPFKKETIPEVKGEMYFYPGNEKYQIQNHVVVAAFKEPVQEEKTLLYWKHKFKNCESSERALPRESSSHTPPEIEFSCDALGLRVIYTEGSGIVSRVIEYAQK